MKKSSYEFKAWAVERALGRDPDVSLRRVAVHLGVDHPTLRRWVNRFENQPWGEHIMNEEKSPQLWTVEQRLKIVIACESMDEEQISAYCREHGICPHHVKQWKAEILKAMSVLGKSANPAQVKQLREENKSLRKELRRKEKALAEAAALLVPKKSRADVGNRRGQLTVGDERRQIIASVKEAVDSGANLGLACETKGISARTYQRWNKPDNACDRRPGARCEPRNKLGEHERQKLLDVANSPEYEALPPSKIVPLFADSGQYLASESMFYKVFEGGGTVNSSSSLKTSEGRQAPRSACLWSELCVHLGHNLLAHKGWWGDVLLPVHGYGRV